MSSLDDETHGVGVPLVGHSSYAMTLMTDSLIRRAEKAEAEVERLRMKYLLWACQDCGFTYLAEQDTGKCPVCALDRVRAVADRWHVIALPLNTWQAADEVRAAIEGDGR